MRFYIYLNIIYQVFALNRFYWKKNSWRDSKFLKKQIPIYKDANNLRQVEEKLFSSNSLVLSSEIKKLQKDLRDVHDKKAFILTAGDCAEAFSELTTENIRDSFRTIMQMSLIMSYGGLRIINIGRIAGQFAKPRSNPYETKNNITLPSYQGDIINNIEFSEKSRQPNPNLMIKAYQTSVSTMNILRSLMSTSLVSLQVLNDWNWDIYDNSYFKKNKNYQQILQIIDDSFGMLHGININIEKLKIKNFYIAHECLLLNYEENFVKREKHEPNYDLSSHFLWIGERTRNLNSSHIEFCRGLNNPLGIKISEKINAEELCLLIDKLNIFNTPGKITLIVRMGTKNLKLYLPNLIKHLQNEKKNVIWMIDPCHANGYTTKNGYKTRNIQDIKSEIKTFFEIHKEMDSFVGGIHLEMTGQTVTECIGGNINSEEDLSKNYKSKCDPRLNREQSIEIALYVSELLKMYQ